MVGSTFECGGCVAQGTPILKENWEYVAIEDLQVSDTVLGYDFDEQRLVEHKVKSIEVAVVEHLLNINEGVLRVTPTHQPIYVRTSSYEGWVTDPGELQINDELFDPVNETWISVESLVYETGTFVVYDIQTRGTNTFISNGILLDVKLP